MKIIKSYEYKEAIAAGAILFILVIILAAALIFINAHYAREAIIDNHAAIVGAVVDKYPGSEQDVIRQIIRTDEAAAERGYALLSRYGIDDDMILSTDLMRSAFHLNAGMYLLLSAFSCCAFLLLILRLQSGNVQRIKQITAYTRRIKNGDYSLDIRDNKEGSTSLLKNEIFKITTMLKEQAEVLKHDRIVLADSLADISHQIKTPLTSLFVLTDLLYDQQTEKTSKEFLERMRAQLKRIEWLVMSLLTLSKLDAGAIILQKEPVNVTELLSKTLDIVSVPFDIKRLQVKVSGDKDVYFEGDFKWTREALLNIIKNCIEHTPERGCVKISYQENPLYTMIVISDNGHGIAKKDLPYVFNRFYKGANAGDDSVGIGLAMARAIIVSQGGDINVSSEEGFGTEFVIKFYKGIM